MPQPDTINPVVYKFLMGFATLCVAMILSVFGKILWNFLSRERETGVCPMHEHMENECIKLEQSMTAIRTRYVDRDEHRQEMGLLRDSIGGINDKISVIKDDITTIKVDIAHLSAKKN
jgi:hypothetical protein